MKLISNVGKSSFINTLLNRKNFARTSGQPGKTQLLNFYNIDDQLHFVDVPGYGYARVYLWSFFLGLSNHLWLSFSVNNCFINNNFCNFFMTWNLEIIAEDIQKFGLIPEFIGRLPIVAALERLTEEDLIQILTEPKKSI